MNKSLTVIIPAYNEQENLPQALDDMQRALEGLVDDYEIIVVDDGSKDRTPLIAQERARRDARFKCISNESNSGYGYSYQRGVTSALKDYVGVFNGDNDMHWESFRDLVKNIGQADIISQYSSNPQTRPWFRRLLSKTFTILMNALFGMNIKYFNGCLICRRDILQSLTMRSRGLTVLAECKVRLIKQGYSYLEIPFIHVPRRGGRSTALSFKSIKTVIKAVGYLYKDIYWKK
jgi:glycosyltransferase involved in cell wall biosynthesis